jgi:hypothetical protein
MPFTTISFETHKPGFSPADFAEYYEWVHVPFLKEAAGSSFPNSHARYYIKRNLLFDPPPAPTIPQHPFTLFPTPRPSLALPRPHATLANPTAQLPYTNALPEIIFPPSERHPAPPESPESSESESSEYYNMCNPQVPEDKDLNQDEDPNIDLPSPTWPPVEGVDPWVLIGDEDAVDYDVIVVMTFSGQDHWSNFIFETRESKKVLDSAKNFIVRSKTVVVAVKEPKVTLG